MNPEQLEIVLKRMLGEGVSLLPSTYAVLLIALALAVVLGAFLASYLQEKGKNQATREDIQQILAHLDQTTRVAEEIKSQVSAASWLRQQIWSEKMRLYAEILQAFEDVRYSTASMAGMHATYQKEQDPQMKDGLLRQIDTHHKVFLSARGKVLQSASAGQIVFSPQAWEILDRFRSSLGLEQTTDIQSLFDTLAATSKKAVDSLAQAAREDLGLAQGVA